MDHLLLALVLLSVCVFEPVDAAPTETQDRASTSRFEGTIADIEYLEDSTSGDQWESCDSDEYQCDNDECISSIYKCDGEYDCEDNSDELDCGASTIIETTVQRETPNCFRPINLSAGDTMSLTTPNFPKNYESYLNCLWTISAPDNVIIRVAFLSFQTETLYDVVSAGSGLGPETGRREISRHSGDELPRSFSGSPNVWISFTSDGSIEDVGFSALISAHEESTEASMATNATIQTSDCHGRFHLSVGSTLTLTTPNFPDHYDSLLSCLWTISVPEDVIIRVHFHSFQTEYVYDVMSAGLGLKPETGTTVISQHSGGELPKSFSGSPNVWINFTSDPSIEASGFSATITAYKEICLAENTVLFDERKTFAEAQASCRENGLTLVKDRSESVHSQIISLLSSHGYSNTDIWINGYQNNDNTWVTTDGDDLTGYNHWALGEPNGIGGCLQLWGAFGHGWDDSPCSVMKPYICGPAESTEASVVFNTTTQRQALNYKERLNLLPGDSYMVTTPNFPNQYCSSLNYFLTLSAPYDVIVRVAFISFTAEAGKEFMSAGRGLGPETGTTVIDRHSGDELPRSFSGSPNAWIQFTSDRSIEDIGFSARVSAYKPEGKSVTL
ncbi:tolloid-like protein 1 [Ptychodera flava]|uniref:tolloid-like protein 1 n=1 Tax=Ptychodera flava TaxID=63121 RepID=UPI00396A4EE7